MWARWRASGDCGSNLLLKQQLIVLRRGPPTGAEPDAERPAALRIRVTVHQSRTNPSGRHWPYAPRRSWHSIRCWCVASTAVYSPRARAQRSPDRRGPARHSSRPSSSSKSRNPRFGCPRIARIVSHTFGVQVDKNVVYRVLSKHSRPAPGGTGPSWLSFIGHTTDSLWSLDLFRCESIVLRSYWVLGGHGPVHASPGRSRRAPRSGQERRPLPHLQRRHSWKGRTARSQDRSRSTVRGAPRTANLRILEIDEIKTVPLVPPRHTHSWSVYSYDAARISRPCSAWLRLLVPDDVRFSVVFGRCCSEVAPELTACSADGWSF